jgi:hypothetical protein
LIPLTGILGGSVWSPTDTVSSGLAGDGDIEFQTDTAVARFGKRQVQCRGLAVRPASPAFDSVPAVQQQVPWHRLVGKRQQLAQQELGRPARNKADRAHANPQDALVRAVAGVRRTDRVRDVQRYQKAGFAGHVFR